MGEGALDAQAKTPQPLRGHLHSTTLPIEAHAREALRLGGITHVMAGQASSGGGVVDSLHCLARDDRVVAKGREVFDVCCSAKLG